MNLYRSSFSSFSRTYRPFVRSRRQDARTERMAHPVEPQQPNEWLSRVLEAAQAAAEDTGSTACEIIAYLGAVPPAHLRPAGAPATPMLSAATPSTHSPRSSLLAERVARLKQSVASGERRVLEMARCYRSCLFMCSKPGVLGKKDEVKRCATGCVTQCETLAGVSETQLANLG